jgi:hypothetical protein
MASVMLTYCWLQFIYTAMFTACAFTRRLVDWCRGYGATTPCAPTP